MHKRYLWIDVRGAGLYWPAPGNVDISATGKGTLAYWTRTPNTNWRTDQYLWRIWVNDSNYVSSRGRAIQVASGGTLYYAGSIDNSIPEEDRKEPELHVLTWDFVSGEIRAYYNDAVATHDPVTSVPAPGGSPSGIYLGGDYVADWPSAPWWIRYCANQEYYMLGIWDDVMSEAQISTLYQQGHQTHIFQPEEGSGNLTFRMKFDSGLDADIAEGEGNWTQDDGSSADRFCLQDTGIRTLGTAIHPLGIPRHDGSDDDRMPLHSACPIRITDQKNRDHTTDTNETNYSKLRLEGLDIKRGGADFPDVPKPGTYRQWIHVPDNDVTPAGYEMGIGPLAYVHHPFPGEGVYDWGSGRTFEVVSDAGNTNTTFKTDLIDTEDDYWNGALLTFITGNCAGRSLYVADYNDTTKFITLETALPAEPEAGSITVVNPFSRIMGQNTGESLSQYWMEASLWAQHGENDYHFVLLEWQQAETAGLSTLRYEKGRTAVMPGVPYVSVGRGANYGSYYWDDGYWDQPGGTNLEIWLEKIEIGGPQTYQILRRDGRNIGPALADNFMVLTRSHDGTPGDSVKVWCQQNLTFNKQRPTKISNYDAVTADLYEPGTWREDSISEFTSLPTPVSYDAENEVIICALQATDGSEVTRLGYIQGTWDEETGRISWTDEQPPPGKSNPFLDTSTLRCERESDSRLVYSYVRRVIPSIDGTWSLIYRSNTDTADEAGMYALHGAADRWSFDHSSQFAGEIIAKGGKGIDILQPGGGGYSPWGNAHMYGPILHNPYAQATEKQYMAFMSAKTILHNGTSWNTDCRPIVAFAGADIKSLTPQPYNREISPLPAPDAHGLNGGILGQEDCIGLLIEGSGGGGFTQGVGLFTSEDGIHFQEMWPSDASLDAFIPQGELPGESTRLSPGPTFRLGDKRIYYYMVDWSGTCNFAWCRYNGETWYNIADGETSAYLETPILEKPKGGWGELHFNLELNNGDVQVEVWDPQTEQPLAGYGKQDCDSVGSGIEQLVTWQAASLSELTADYLRLRIHLTRPESADESPQLFAWEIKPKVVQYPSASELQVEGESSPANVVDPTPTFSWTYQHPQGSPQSAYQIIVASSQQQLDSGIGDLWDSGVVLSSQTTATYQGQALADYQTYFWKVRVRSAEGVWSEEW